uniref:VWFA domain-containing protein n=1 Tax=Plectus sambesii TaxID=2011161 RepID=A0A914V6K8_9BILA
MFGQLGHTIKTVISSANSLQYVGNGAVTANYTAVLDYISNTVLQPQNGFKNRSTIVIFITSAPPTNVTGASAPGSLFVNFASSPSASNLQSRANVMGLALGQSAS